MNSLTIQNCKKLCHLTTCITKTSCDSCQCRNCQHSNLPLVGVHLFQLLLDFCSPYLKAHRGSRGEATLILNPDTRQMSVVKVTDQPLYPKENVSQKSLERRLGGPHSPPAHCGEQKNLLALVGSGTTNHLAGSTCQNHWHICALCSIPCFLNISCLAFSLNMYTALLVHRFTVPFRCFHVPADVFMSCARSSTHKPLGLYPHQLCEATSFSSSVTNMTNEFFQVTGIASTASYRSWFQFLGCAAVSLGEQILLFCHTAFIFLVKQSKKNVWLWRWRHYNPSAATCPTTQCHIPEDLNLQQRCCDNLKSLLHNVLQLLYFSTPPPPLLWYNSP